jgi:hypothetical protein
MIELFLTSIYFVVAALLIGIATARWAFPKQAAPAEPKKEDEPAS